MLIGFPSLLAAQATFLGQQVNTLSPGLGNAHGVAINSSGIVAVGDTGNQRVLRISPSGAVTQVLSGNYYGGVAIDNAGNIYTSHDNTMYKIAPDNSVSTVTLGIQGDIDSWCQPFLIYESLGQCEGDAVSRGAAVDLQGNVYLSEYEVTGGVVVVPAGGGSPYYLDTSPFEIDSPLALANDKFGDIYINDSFNGRIVVHQPDGANYGIAPPGLNIQGDPCCNFPGLYTNQLDTVGVDREGNIYVGGSQHNGGGNFLYRITPDGQSYFSMPQGYAGTNGIGETDSNDNLVYINENDQLVYYALEHADFGSVPVGTTSVPITLQFLMGSGSALTTISLYSQGYNPNAVGSGLAEFGTTAAMSCSGSPVICSVPVTFTPSAPGPRNGFAIPYDVVGIASIMARVPVIGNGTGANPVIDSASFTATPVQISSSYIGTPTQSATDGAGYTYVAVPVTNQVIAVAPGGATSTVNTGSYTLSKPQGVALDGSGDLFIADTGNNRILVVNLITELERNTIFAIDSTPRLLSAPGITLNGPTALATDSLGNLYVANTGSDEIDKISFAGFYLDINRGTGSVLVSNVEQPDGVAVDGAGNVYFPNGFNVDELSAATGAVTQILTTPNVDAPIGVAVDAGGTVYVADAYEGIVQLHTDGTVTRDGLYNSQGVSVSGLGVITVTGPGTPAGYTGTVIFQIARTAPSLTFANTTVGLTSSDSPQTVTVSNAGNQPVTFTALSYPNDFPESGSGVGACTSTSSLTSGQSCQLPISFTPKSAATLNEAVTFTSNTLTTTSTQQSISVTGVSNNGGLSQTIAIVNRNQQVANICCGIYGSTGASFYVTSSSGLPVTLKVLSGPMNFSGSLTTTVNTTAGLFTFVGSNSSAAGSGVIQATQGGNATYAPAAPVTLTYTVNPASTSIRQFTPTPLGTQVYGSPVQTLTYVLQGILAHDQVSLVVTSGVSPASPVGSYTVTVALAGPSAPNYNLTTTTLPFTVTPAPLSVEAVDAYQLVGAAPGSFTYALAGFLNGDTASVVTGAPTLATTATSSSPAGTYAITVGAGTLSAANYAFPNLVNGELNIFAPINLGYGNVGSQSVQSFSFPTGMAGPATRFEMLTGGSPTGSLGVGNFQCTPGTPGSCAGTLTFTPAAAGLWTGALQIFDGSTPANLLVSIPVSGTGLGPQVAFSGGTQTVVTNSGILGMNGMAFDGAGNMFISVYNPNTSAAAVYKLPPGGSLTSIGTGWKQPESVVVDGAGNVYVADGGFNGNGVVKITPAGVQSTVSFCLNSFPGALGLDANGNIYASEGGLTICRNTPGGTESAFYPATDTDGFYPFVSSLAFSPTGQLYFADEFYGYIFTVPQGGPATLYSFEIPGPTSIAFDAAGNLYSASMTSGKMGLYELAPTYGVTQLISVSDNEVPSSVALDPSGNLYLVNSGNGGSPTGQILKLDRADAPGVSFPTPTSAGATDTTDGTNGIQTVIVQNIGNQPLQISGLTYPADFPEASGVATDCTSSTNLAAGSSCTLSISFSPLLASSKGTSTPLHESVSLTDNNLNAASVQQSIAVSGTETLTSALTSPTPNSVLPGPKVTFTWSGSPAASGYKLWIGSSAGKNNLYTSGQITTASATPTTLPTNGETIYVTLVTVYGSSQVSAAYTFTAATQSALTSPTPNTVLAGPKITFNWSASPSATAYELLIGTSIGKGNLYTSGSITATSAAPGSLPINGETLYVRLYTIYGSIQVYTDYLYTAATPAAMTSPAPASVLAGPKVTFNWSASPGATAYKLWIGSSAGKNNLYSSGAITATNATAAGLPTNGETIYVTLVTVYGTVQVNSAFVYTATTPAALTSPAASSVLTGPKVTFNWSSSSGATAYKLLIGTFVGANNLYNSGSITTTSATPGALPTNGETIYVTLTTVYGTSQVSTAYTFTAATQAVLTSPTPGTTLPGAAVPFTWSASPQATSYKLWIGSSAGKNDLYSSGAITSTTATPTKLPTNGETVYVTLVTVYGASQVNAAYTFTAAP